MYYALHSDLIVWHNQILQAWPVGETAQHQMREKPHWWEAEPWIPPPPLLIFAINSKAPLLDNYDTGTLFDLYSPRLIELLRDAGVHFETFPVRIMDRKTDQELTTIVDRKTRMEVPVRYEVFHLLDKWTRNEARAEMHRSSRKLMFRDAEYMQFSFIHEDLKEVLDRENITGCAYTPGDRYRLA